ncbi:MAG: molecular chaperone TorD family protein [Desulfovermiculus sp.]
MMLKLLSNLLDEPDLTSALNNPEQAGLPSAMADGLAGLLLNEPTQNSLQLIPTLFRNIPEELQRDMPDPDAEPPELQVLRDDYLDLFLSSSSGRYKAPYGAVWLEGRFNGTTTSQVGEIYTQAGFDPSLVSVSEHWLNPFMPDHIGFELAFLAGLLYSAREKGETDPDEARELVATAYGFAEQPMSLWAGSFGRNVREAAHTSVYQDLGGLLMILFPEG